METKCLERWSWLPCGYECSFPNSNKCKGDTTKYRCSITFQCPNSSSRWAVERDRASIVVQKVWGAVPLCMMSRKRRCHLPVLLRVPLDLQSSALLIELRRLFRCQTWGHHILHAKPKDRPCGGLLDGFHQLFSVLQTLIHHTKAGKSEEEPR